MAEDKEYVVRSVEKKAEAIEAIVDQKMQEESQPLQPSQPSRQKFQIPQIPTDKIFRTLTDREMMRQLLHDETMEPHVHMIKLLFIVFVLAIIIVLLGI